MRTLRPEGRSATGRYGVAMVAGLVGAALLAGCGPSAPSVSTPPSTSAAPSTSTESPGPTEPSTAPSSAGAAAPTNQAGGSARCQTNQLSARVGQPTSRGNDQTEVPLVYTNTSGRACQLHGVPGLDLRGPNDPNGPVYSLPRQDRGGNVTLAPGASATAKIVVLSWSDGSIGSMGSTRWVPTQLVTIPPGQTTPLTTPWPKSLSVLRQDSATHPGSWVESFTSGAR